MVTRSVFFDETGAGSKSCMLSWDTRHWLTIKKVDVKEQRLVARGQTNGRGPKRFRHEFEGL
jgi:hypothetical protein